MLEEEDLDVQILLPYLIDNLFLSKFENEKFETFQTISASLKFENLRILKNLKAQNYANLS